jgi:adenylate cyclase
MGGFFQRGMVILCIAFVFPLAAADSPFALVFIDAKTEQELGAFPLDRALIAKGVRQLKAVGAKAVVLKFFYDQPREAASDAALANALGELPVALQARLDDSESTPNKLPDKFFLTGLKLGESSALAGKSGWLPLPSLAAGAAAVGFVDIADASRVPVIGSYQGRCVKSLHLCAVELALGAQAVVEPGKRLTVAGRSVALDGANSVPAEFPRVGTVDYLPFHELLANSERAAALKGKVVVVGYDGAKMNTLATPAGQRKAHRVFWHGLQSLWTQLK